MFCSISSAIFLFSSGKYVLAYIDPMAFDKLPKRKEMIQRVPEKVYSKNG